MLITTPETQHGSDRSNFTIEFYVLFRTNGAAEQQERVNLERARHDNLTLPGHNNSHAEIEETIQDPSVSSSVPSVTDDSRRRSRSGT